MTFKLNYERISMLLIQKRLLVLLSLAGFLIFLISVSSFNYFTSKKKALLSAQIAIGFANLEQGSKDLALLHFQNAFNSSKGVYGIISGAGIIRALEGADGYQAKSQNILSIIKDYKSSEFIKAVITSSYLQNLSHFNKKEFDEKEFQAFIKTANKLGEPFNQAVQNINLNLGR